MMYMTRPAIGARTAKKIRPPTGHQSSSSQFIARYQIIPYTPRMIGYEATYMYIYRPANPKIKVIKGKICRTAEQPSFNFLLVKNVAIGAQKQPIRNQMK